MAAKQSGDRPDMERFYTERSNLERFNLERSSPAIQDDRRLAELLNEQTAVESMLPDLEDFVGRQTEMQQAIALWRQLRPEPGTTPVLAIVGPPGVGKSAFALRLAERVQPIAAAQLYFNLRNDRSVSPATTSPGTISSATIVQQAQSALLNAGDQPILVLLDDLEDQTLLPPLLRLGTGYRLLVTSRQPLAAATNTATDTTANTATDTTANTATGNTAAIATLELQALSERDAMALLQSIVKSKPIQADSEIARSVVRCCDALPLALRLVGGLLQTQPQLQWSECLQQFSAERQRCEQAHLSYPAIRASFNLSYQHLDARSTRLLRLLGLLPEPSVTLKTAAALSETSIYFARDSIAQLLRVRLLESTAKERYRLSDLLRLLAKGQLAIEESTETRQAARLRLIQSYQETAEVMSLGLDASSRHQIARIYGRGRADFEQSLLFNAQNWFAAERSNLLTALDWAFQAEAWAIGLDIVNSLALFLAMRGEWTEVEVLLLRAISVAESADRLQTAQWINRLGNAYLQQGEWEKAKAPYQQSLKILHDLQEPVRESQTLTNLGIAYLEQGDRQTAATLWTAALTLLPTGSTHDRDLTQWMQATNEALLETVLLQLDDRQPSRRLLDAIGGALKRLLF